MEMDMWLGSGLGEKTEGHVEASKNGIKRPRASVFASTSRTRKYFVLLDFCGEKSCFSSKLELIPESSSGTLLYDGVNGHIILINVSIVQENGEELVFVQMQLTLLSKCFD
jgi:hypothetical protein